MTTIAIDRSVVKQALEALKLSTPQPRPTDDDYSELGWKEHNAAITALHDALAQEQAEPMQQRAGIPLEAALHKAYYYTEEGKWRGTEAREWDRWHAVAKAAVALIRPERSETREHVTDGTPCWCGSEAAYTDPDTGASVILHKRPQ